MIDKKFHICECGRNAYSFKRCGICRGKKYAENALKRKSERGGESGIDDLDNYFNFHIGNIIKTKACCAECGVRLPQIPDRKNVCHVLPKTTFVSIRSVHENCIYLCWQHHSEFDSTYEKAKKMKVWATAVSIFKTLKPLIKERHKILQHYED